MKKRKKPKSVLPRSLKHFRDAGFIVHKTEHWNAFAKRRIDCFGFGDLLVAGPVFGLIALVQVTTTANLAARRKKAMAIPALRIWLASGGRFLLHGWSKRGPRGKRKRWELTQQEIKLSDLEASDGK